jgi:hypothetical protein
MKSQGYSIVDNMFEQDTESAIKLEQNGRTSAGPTSRHINIRYFWLKDRTKAENISIRHCPTLQMLADFFTKPLQGSLFKRFCVVILGHKHIDTLALIASSDTQTEERVEDDRRSNAIGTCAPINGIGTDDTDNNSTDMHGAYAFDSQCKCIRNLG